MIRNLIYHFYTEKRKFDFHYEYLMRYLPVFNGRKIICLSISKSDDTYNIEEIQHLFKGLEIVEVDNDSDSRESKSFFEILLPEIINEPGITFFGHSKSSSAKRLDPKFNEAHTLWASHLYTANLSDITNIESVLNTYVSCGPFLRTTYLQEIPCCKWHFSGTMFWFNNKMLRDMIDSINSYTESYGKKRWGVEGFLGSIVGIDRTYCIFDIPGDLGCAGKDNVLLMYNNKKE